MATSSTKANSQIFVRQWFSDYIRTSARISRHLENRLGIYVEAFEVSGARAEIGMLIGISSILRHSWLSCFKYDSSYRAGKAPSMPQQEEKPRLWFWLTCVTIPLIKQIIKNRLYYSKKLSTKLKCTGGMQAVNIGLYNEMKPLKCLWPRI